MEQLQQNMELAIQSILVLFIFNIILVKGIFVSFSGQNTAKSNFH